MRVLRILTSAAAGVRRSRCADVDARDLGIVIADGELPARLYTPAGLSHAPGPLMLFFHGGGFISGGLETHDEICRILSAHATTRVMSVACTLAPEISFAGQVEQAVTVCRWVRAPGHGDLGEITTLAVAGDSSGGYLAARAALALNGEAPGAIGLQLLLYPLVQLDDRLWARPRLRDFRPIGRIAAGIIRRNVGSPVPSLLDLDLRPAPSTVIASGGLDPTSSDAVALGEYLRASGVAVDSVRFRILPHGTFNLTHLSDRAFDALKSVGELAGRRLGPVAL